MRLRLSNGLPPGGILFTDPRVPTKHFNDDHTFFGDRVVEIRRFRLANAEVYDPVVDAVWLTPEHIGEELIAFNCHRLGHHKDWCYDENQLANSVKGVTAAIQPANAENHLCECGAYMNPRYCQTCGGNKINGWDCPNCGKKI